MPNKVPTFLKNELVLKISYFLLPSLKTCALRKGSDLAFFLLHSSKNE